MLVGRRGSVKIWFGLRPEQGICLDVTHKGDCVSSHCLKPSPFVLSLHILAVVYQNIVCTCTGMPW